MCSKRSKRSASRGRGIKRSRKTLINQGVEHMEHMERMEHMEHMEHLYILFLNTLFIGPKTPKTLINQGVEHMEHIGNTWNT